MGPETFSFTLSEAWTAGLPAVVPPIGALVDRVSATGAGWVLTEEEWRSDERMLDRIVAVLDPTKKDAYELAAARARANSLNATRAVARAPADGPQHHERRHGQR